MLQLRVWLVLNESHGKRGCFQLPLRVTFAGVDSTQLTPDQLRKVRAIALRHAEHLQRLVERMQALNFPSNDRLYDATVMARNAADQIARAAMVGAVRH